jgi:hypothetical protein
VLFDFLIHTYGVYVVWENTALLFSLTWNEDAGAAHNGMGNEMAFKREAMTGSDLLMKVQAAQCDMWRVTKQTCQPQAFIHQKHNTNTPRI